MTKDVVVFKRVDDLRGREGQLEKERRERERNALNRNPFPT